MSTFSETAWVLKRVAEKMREPSRTGLTHEVMADILTEVSTELDKKYGKQI